MKNKITVLMMLLVSLCLSSCSSSEQASVREAIENCFAACQRGDLEMALEYVSPGEITLMQLTGENRDKWIAQMGEIAKRRLSEATVTVEEVTVSGDYAQAKVTVTTPAGEQKSSIGMRKSGESWLLEDLPLIK